MFINAYSYVCVCNCACIWVCVPVHSLVDQLGVSVYLPPLCAVLWEDDGVHVCVFVYARVCLCGVCVYVCVCM